MNAREKLVELLTEFYGSDPMYYGVDALAIAQHLIDNGVTVQSERMVDAVPVVRCKDCIYSYEEFGFIYCTFGSYGDCKVPSQFYCAEGKRKEDK